MYNSQCGTCPHHLPSLYLSSGFALVITVYPMATSPTMDLYKSMYRCSKTNFTSPMIFAQTCTEDDAVLTGQQSGAVHVTMFLDSS